MKQFETVTFKGTAVHTNGMMPQKGEMAPDFTAVAGDLSDLSLGSLKGKRVILNIFSKSGHFRMRHVGAQVQCESGPFGECAGIGRIHGFTFCTRTLLYD